MLKKSTKTVLAVLALFFAFFAAFASDKAKAPSPAVSLAVPNPPIPVRSDGVINIAYELEFTSFADSVLTLESVESINKITGKTILTLEGDSLPRMYHPASPASDAPSMYKLPCPKVSIWLKQSPDDVPEKLMHRVTFKNSVANNMFSVTGGETDVLVNVKPIVIKPPLKGDGWVAVETTCGVNHHFLSQLVHDGKTYVPMRFAQDFIMIDPQEKSVVSGDFKKNESWYGYGKELVAVADGVVVSVFDRVTDNAEVGVMGPSFRGNYVTIQIDANTFASYLHVIPGSFKVKVGDNVKTGDVLGMLGNSGGSLVPHLHFQITDRNDVRFSEGKPYVIDFVDVVGDCPFRLFALHGMPADGGVRCYLTANPQNDVAKIIDGAKEYLSHFSFPDAIGKFFVHESDFKGKEKPPVYYAQPKRHQNELMENSVILNFPK